MDEKIETRDVFISHAEEDSDLAASLRERLRGDGLSAWDYKHEGDVPPLAHHRVWAHDVIGAHSRCFVVLVSPFALSSADVYAEYSRAIEVNLRRAPILVDLSYETLKTKFTEWSYPMGGKVPIQVARSKWDAELPGIAQALKREVAREQAREPSAAAGGREVPSRGAGECGEAGPPARPRRRRRWAGAVAALVVLAGVAVALWRTGGRPRVREALIGMNSYKVHAAEATRPDQISPAMASAIDGANAVLAGQREPPGPIHLSGRKASCDDAVTKAIDPNNQAVLDYISPFTYIHHRERLGPPRCRVVAQKKFGDWNFAFEALFVVHKDSPAYDPKTQTLIWPLLADRKVLLLKCPVSTSAHVVPLTVLAEHGVVKPNVELVDEREVIPDLLKTDTAGLLVGTMSGEDFQRLERAKQADSLRKVQTGVWIPYDPILRCSQQDADLVEPVLAALVTLGHARRATDWSDPGFEAYLDSAPLFSAESAPGRWPLGFVTPPRWRDRSNWQSESALDRCFTVQRFTFDQQSEKVATAERIGDACVRERDIGSLALPVGRDFSFVKGSVEPYDLDLAKCAPPSICHLAPSGLRPEQLRCRPIATLASLRAPFNGANEEAAKGPLKWLADGQHADPGIVWCLNSPMKGTLQLGYTLGVEGSKTPSEPVTVTLAWANDCLHASKHTDVTVQRLSPNAQWKSASLEAKDRPFNKIVMVAPGKVKVAMGLLGMCAKPSVSP